MPERFKDVASWSPAEHAAYVEAGRRPETLEWRAAVRDALEAGGVGEVADELHARHDAEPDDLESLTPAQHFDRIRGGR